jgi:hypothetical protein
LIVNFKNPNISRLFNKILIDTKTTFDDGFACTVGAGYHGAGAWDGEADDRRGRD